MKKEIQELYTELKTKISLYRKDYDEGLLQQSFNYISKIYKEDNTNLGDPYVTHLLRTAINLALVNADLSSIISGLLHDVIRDEKASFLELEKKFGVEIATICQAVSDLSEFTYSSKQKNLTPEFLKEIFEVAGRDLRVFLVKICGRIDFLESSNFLKDEHILRKAKETLYIYIPIIKILGIGKYISHLEDVCFKVIDSAEYEKINKVLGKKRKSLEQRMEKLKSLVLFECKKEGFEIEVEGRIKTIYSIYKKMSSKNIPFSNIYDVLAIRIITKNKKEVYSVLGIVHSIFKTEGDRMKDYISSPKPNGYQSLHTTLSDSEGEFFEVQILTKQMHKLNTFGLAAHSFYKGYSNKEEIPDFIKEISEIQKLNIENGNVLDLVNKGIIKENIICFTPKGQEIILPKGSVLLDFAFRLHSGFGERLEGASINGEFSDDLLHELKDLDQIDLKLSDEKVTLKVSYLSFVKTNTARKGLKAHFKENSIDKVIELGKYILDDKMELFGYKPFCNMPKFIVSETLEKFFFKNIDNLYIEIGLGNLDVDRIVNFIYSLKNDSSKYKNIISLRIDLKNKNHEAIFSIFDVVHALNSQLVNISYSSLHLNLDIYVKNLKILHELTSELSRIPNVYRVYRRFTGRIYSFIGILTFSSLLIILSPAILFFLKFNYNFSELFYKIFFYSIIFAFVFLIYFFKHIASVTLPGVIKQRIFWVGMFALNTLILATVILESIYIFDARNSVWFFSLTLFLYGLTTFEYLDSKHLNKEDNL